MIVCQAFGEKPAARGRERMKVSIWFRVPDVVVGLSEGKGSQMTDHYQPYLGHSVIKKEQFSFYLLKSTRFPESSMKLVDFLSKSKNFISKAD